jgi:hypothetical protein
MVVMTSDNHERVQRVLYVIGSLTVKLTGRRTIDDQPRIRLCLMRYRLRHKQPVQADQHDTHAIRERHKQERSYSSRGNAASRWLASGLRVSWRVATGVF